MLHLLPPLHKLADVKRNLLARVPAIHGAALIAAREQCALYIPREARDAGLVARDLARLLLHLARRANARVVVADGALVPAERERVRVPAHRRHAFGRPARELFLRFGVPDLHDARRRTQRHDVRLIRPRARNDLQVAMRLAQLAQLPDLVVAQQDVLEVDAVTAAEEENVVGRAAEELGRVVSRK